MPTGARAQMGLHGFHSGTYFPRAYMITTHFLAVKLIIKDAIVTSGSIGS